MTRKELELRTIVWDHLRPSLALLFVLFVLLAAAYPAVLTGLDDALNPNGAAGDELVCDGQVVGSTLIAQNISSPMFFHPRNASQSDSGVDPDLPPPAAYAQVPGISAATGISNSSLDFLVQQNANQNAADNSFTAPPYVNVNALNVMLVELYPSTYSGYCAS